MYEPGVGNTLNVKEFNKVLGQIFDFTLANLEPLVITRLTQEPLQAVIEKTREAAKIMSARRRPSFSRVNMREAIEKMKKEIQE